ncbi:MAG: tRNA uracil 4-sulfurtransferase ThiI [Thermofilaceae archaeon]
MLVVLLLRLGEITIKGPRTRRRFEKLLQRNIKEALHSAGIEYTERREGGRIFIYCQNEDKALEILRRVFGIKSLSKAVEIEFTDLNDLVAKAEEVFREKVKGKRFAVRARRVGSHSFTSLDVEKALGAALLGYGAGVDLENPNVTVYVEVRGQRAYLYTDVVRAYGGLPIGSEGRVLALVSGGFDSAVAAWFMLRRGAEVHYLLCRLGGAVQEAGVLHVLKVLAERWSYGYRPKLYVVDFSEILKSLRKNCDPSFLTVLLKRFMLRAAEAIALKEGFEAVVMGDSLGQASSQTLTNLSVTSEAVRILVFRPLIGFDKDDIVALAREIGTYEASARVKEYCGAFSEHPRTRVKLDEVKREEGKLDPTLLDKALSRVVIYDLKEVSVEEAYGELEVETPPPDSIIVDLRSSSSRRVWSIPGSISMDFDQLIEGAAGLDPAKKYVLVCDEGALSLEAAYMLRKLGFQAYSLRGGAKRLRRKLTKS